MAGSGSASSIEGFIYIAMNAFYQAALTFTGQNLGAKKPERISRVLRYCLLLVFVTGALLGGTVLFFQDALLGIYTDSQEAIRLGGVQLQIIACSYFLCGMMEVLCGQLRGMGYSTVPMLTSLLGACGLRIVWIYTVFQQSHTLFVLYLSYSVTWVVTLLAHYTCYCIVRRRLLRRLAAGIN